MPDLPLLASGETDIDGGKTYHNRCQIAASVTVQIVFSCDCFRLGRLSTICPCPECRDYWRNAMDDRRTMTLDLCRGEQRQLLLEAGSMVLVLALSLIHI